MPNLSANVAEVQQAFTEAMRARHLKPSAVLIGDHRKHRCDATNKTGNHGKNDGEYVLHLDGRPAGAFINYTDGGGWTKWKFGGAYQQPSAAELAQSRAERAQAAQARHVSAKDAARRAREEWSDAEPAHSNNPGCDPLHVPIYLTRKKIQPHGIRQGDWKGRSCLLVPVYSPASNKIMSLQRIFADGSKRFLTGGEMLGGYFRIKPAENDDGKTVIVSESFADAASINQATGHEVYIAFGAGNLLAVAKMVAERRRRAEQIVLAADDDRETAQRVGFNPGIRSAEQAARAIERGRVAYPTFGFDRKSTDKDFNDMAQREDGNDAIKIAIEAARVPKAVSVSGDNRQEALNELVLLDDFEYDRRRKAAANELGVRVKVLDLEVDALRKAKAGGTPAPDFMEPVEPWPTAIRGIDLLEKLDDAIFDYVVVSEPSALAIALWILHAHTIDAATHSPILGLTSPTKRCGKTTLLRSGKRYRDR